MWFGEEESFQNWGTFTLLQNDEKLWVRAIVHYMEYCDRCLWIQRRYFENGRTVVGNEKDRNRTYFNYVSTFTGCLWKEQRHDQDGKSFQDDANRRIECQCTQLYGINQWV